MTSVDQPPDGADRPGVLRLLASLAAVVYVATVAADAVTASVDGRGFVAWRSSLGSVPGRLLVAVVVVGVWYHLLDGASRLWRDHRRATGAVEGRPLVAFLTWAVGVPMAAVILWPLWGSVG
ncbi:MAG: hypothetical protein JJU45_11730 [Acidimicrobiia bacterium]|nr:hypothetical protein [Acidimicrobiia bacterium]